MSKIKKICFISTYVPRQCGIATYTEDVIEALHANDSSLVCDVIAMNDGHQHDYPENVVLKIKQNDPKSYVAAAKKINQSDYDLVSVQHEFGIFGGFNGRYLLYFLRAIRKPVALTMHTVPIAMEKPFRIKSKKQKSRMKLLKEIFKYVKLITVMTQSAKDYLEKEFDLINVKVLVIPHGAPEITEEEKKEYRSNKAKLGFEEDEFIITTFGLISPKKGLEYVIKAMPKIIRNNSSKKVKYLIAGRAHPKQPPKYMLLLKSLVKKYSLENQVVFETRYLDDDDIYHYLSISDIYLTPYYAKEQASSGTLSYAIACGCCVVSTPYIFAKDLLERHNIGRLVEFKNAGSIAKAVSELIIAPDQIKSCQDRSAKLSKYIFWPRIGKRFLDSFNNIVN